LEDYSNYIPQTSIVARSYFKPQSMKKHKQKPILTETKIRKWKWIGHMLTKPPSNITKTTVE
jgi:hypothetical protein